MSHNDCKKIEDKNKSKSPKTPKGIYAYIYGLIPQTVAVEADVLFSNNGVITPGITHTPGNVSPAEKIIFSRAGDYEVSFLISVGPNAAAGFQVALFLQSGGMGPAVVVPGSEYGAGLAPVGETVQLAGQAIVFVKAGDVLTLRNHSSFTSLFLASGTVGGTQVITNVSVLVRKL